MRFILLAVLMIGVALYISNPEAFGKKQKFQLSGSGRVVREDPDHATIDFEKIGEFGADLFQRFTEAPETPAQDSPVQNGVIALSATTQNAEATLPVTTAPVDALSTYQGQIAALSTALRADEASTVQNIQSAMQACTPEAAPAQLNTYFAGLVKVVVETTTLPADQQADQFKAKVTPLTQALKLWLQFLPDDQRAANTAILQDWAARPKDLIACNTAWLSANER